MTVSFSFVSGKFLQLETDCKSIAEFFETYGVDGELASWLVFPNGYAVRSENVDWMKMEAEE